MDWSMLLATDENREPWRLYPMSPAPSSPEELSAGLKKSSRAVCCSESPQVNEYLRDRANAEKMMAYLQEQHAELSELGAACDGGDTSACLEAVEMLKAACEAGDMSACAEVQEAAAAAAAAEEVRSSGVHGAGHHQDFAGHRWNWSCVYSM